MRERQKILALVLAVLVFTVLAVILWLPSRSVKGSVDFGIRDENSNFHYEVGEQLSFVVSDSGLVRDKDLLWELGNGDTLHRNPIATYAYKQAGKYLVTLRLEGRLLASRYIQIVQAGEITAIDSVPRISGVHEAYQDEELTFSAVGQGADTWLWEFGETGTVDAYERQVNYAYEKPGNYTIRLNTNTTKYPIEHKIRILPRFEKAEEVVAVDSLGLAQEDIRRRLQIIANTSVRDKSRYREQINYIRSTYFCSPAGEIAVVVNGDKYNDFLGYCQGLHFLESNPKRRVQIREVKIDNLHCVTTLQVTQTTIEQ